MAGTPAWSGSPESEPSVSTLAQGPSPGVGPQEVVQDLGDGDQGGRGRPVFSWVQTDLLVLLHH